MKLKFWKKSPTVPVLRLNGVIGSSGLLRGGMNLASTAGLIERAFDSAKLDSVAVTINSPGGSPVQSNLIYKRIRQLADEKKKKVYVFMEDVAASGGYFIAMAGDEIYADPSSIVGSIGVVSSGFGFVEAIERLGVERRVYTAGKNKSTLDPFRPEKPEDVERLKALQLEVHQVFIDVVKASRGDKLQGDDDELFTGEFWTGIKAQELGLIDGLSDVRTKMREIHGDEVKLRAIEPKKGLFGRRLPGLGVGLGGLDGASGSGLSQMLPNWSDDLLATLERRAIWNRFGL